MLAEASDRAGAAPIVFAGRTEEIALLELAVRGAQRRQVGHTVVIQGVPGVGKTALRDEFATRLLAQDANDRQAVIPVQLDFGALDSKPAAILEEIDKGFRALEASEWWRRAMQRTADSAFFLGNALFAAATRKDARELTAASKAPDSLSVVLNDYVRQRLGRRGSTILLLVDEAQNLHDTPTVRRHLDVLHNAGDGETPMMLACFGLANTVDRLADLGLSRLATGHTRCIGALSDEHACEAVVGTLNMAFTHHKFADGAFDEEARKKWIGAAATAILEDSGNFPHHLTNGCRALAQAVLREGIGASPPADRIRATSRGYRREYYEARLRPWLRFETALAHAFADSGDHQTATKAVIAALTTVSDLGKPTDEETARGVLAGIRNAGFIEERDESIALLLPSLAAHFQDVRERTQPNARTVEAIKAAQPASANPEHTATR